MPHDVLDCDREGVAVSESPSESLPTTHDAERAELWREAVTMALYVSLSLLAVMTAMSSEDARANSSLAATVALISLGLVLAHIVAFSLSTRLVTPSSQLEGIAPRLIGAQIVGGIAVTVLAALPIVVFGPAAYTASIAILLAFVLLVAYLVARSGGRSAVRSLTYVAIIAVVVLLVLWVKSLAGH